ncbi:MAG: hypothetical protein ACM3Q4_14600 [Acidobacteriota bacterium]
MKRILFFLPTLLLCASLVHAQYNAEGSAERRMIEQVIRQGQAAQTHTPAAPAVSHKDEIAGLRKAYSTFSEARTFLMNGNQIVGNIYDYGGIAPGLGLIRNYNNMVWRGLGDIYQFGPLVAGAVPDKNGAILHFSSDAINDVDARDLDPGNSDHVYGWKALPGYVDPSSKIMASNPAEDKNPKDGKPDSWPRTWYNEQKGQYVWPGYLRQDVPSADLEVLWAMDDRANNEYPYYPFPNDTTIRGLGVKIEGRALQWSSSLAQNCIFFIYTAQNFSPRDLDTVYFGMYGDIDVGGGVAGGTGGVENTDDIAYFISPMDSLHRASHVPVPIYSRSIVYFWDGNGLGYQNIPTHYDACKFLESPGNSIDGINNDGDTKKNGLPMIDESQTNGIDDDGDWNPKTDDVGIDGVPGSRDMGEGDGIPTAGIRMADGTLDPLHPGEPNFELTDLDESDQIGLTAFRSFTIGALRLRDDEVIWGVLEDNFNQMDEIPAASDIAFMYGSGKISLKKANTDGSIKRFSIALLMGANLNDLLISARTVQLIYNQNYQFIRPPDKPVVTAVPGDKKVTLYWDNGAESSTDPILGNDFEGYVIYRSTNPQFTDINLVTDGFGTPLLYQPLTDYTGKTAKWDIAKRPEPFFEDDTSKTKNGRYDLGERFIDVNGNGVYDGSNIADYWQGFAPVPYDQRGIAYYLGDNTGLVHSYVDSFKVVNGQRYYYAVVSYDHGDFTNYAPSECTKRISLDPITSALTFDVNTVEVTPGPRVSGYTTPGFASAQVLDRIGTSGTGTGKITVSVIDDLAIREGIQYRIDFADSIGTNGAKRAALNYAVTRVTPSVAEVTLSDTNFVKLGTANMIVDDALTVVNATTQQAYKEGADYVLETGRGLIRKTGFGAMKNQSVPVKVTFRSYGQLPSTLMANEEANPVFDGMKLFVNNEALAVDTIKSTWVIDNKLVAYKLSDPSTGSKKLAPIDVQFEFTKSDTNAAGQYTVPGDTLYDTKLGKKILTPFKVRNITPDPARKAIPLQVIVRENAPANNRWDWGEPLILVTPPPFRTVSNNTMFEVKFTPKDSLNKKFGGEVFNVVTSQPFSSADHFTFTTVAAKFDASKAGSLLDRVKVVPNPYVASNDIEPTDRLPGTTRGSRRIYFEHLPQEATIRIFTLSGELVRELRHSGGIDNGREYWDLLNRDNLGVAYGVYIAHIEAPGVGERILKFAVIK